MAGQFALGLLVGCVFFFFPNSRARDDHHGAVPEAVQSGSWLLYPARGRVIAGASNAVNLADGLTGWRSVCVAGVPGFAALSYVSAQQRLRRSISTSRSGSGSGELTVFCMAMVGAALAASVVQHPSRNVHGDTGSLMLGGAPRRRGQDQEGNSWCSSAACWWPKRCR
jgi:UDP-N-acetylmuramyl pentapeptide phosphotransferase/UDP-N-acetylglucosamine-1-phosphate transferase